MTTRHFPLLALLILTSCGGDEPSAAPAVVFANEPAGSDYWSRGIEVGPDASPFEADLHGRYVVAPDRALVRVTLSTQGRTRGEAAGRVRDAANELRETLADEGRCVAEVADYETPRRNEEQWSGSASLRYDIELGGLDTVAARFARVEHCMERFSAIGANLSDVRFSVSDPLVTIDAPGRHRAELLERELRALREVAQVAGPAAYDPDAMHCASRGQVSILERSLRGVALGIDLACDTRVAAPAAPDPAS